MRVIDVPVSTTNITIAPLGDIQYGNEGFSQSHFTKAVHRLNSIENLHIIGTGDYLDCMSPSNREAYRKSGLYSSSKRTFQTGAIEPQVHELFNMLPTEANYVALCKGHHYFEYDHGYEDRELLVERFGDLIPRNTDQHLAFLLGAEYVPVMVLVNFRFSSGQVYRVLAWHGEGNGQTLAYGLNKMMRTAAGFEGIDAIFMGHTHKLATGADVRIRYDDEKGDFTDRPVMLLNSGSFLKAYLKGNVAYPETGGLPSLALGHGAITVAPLGKKWDVETRLFY